MASQQETQSFIEALSKELGEPAEYSFHIPGWESVDSKQGLCWLSSQMCEGFYVDYRIDRQNMRVYVKSWEFGQDEPEWTDIDDCSKQH